MGQGEGQHEVSRVHREGREFKLSFGALLTGKCQQRGTLGRGKARSGADSMDGAEGDRSLARG